MSNAAMPQCDKVNYSIFANKFSMHTYVYALNKLLIIKLTGNAAERYSHQSIYRVPGNDEQLFYEIILLQKGLR